MEKGVLELHWAATLQQRKIERSGFFSWIATDKLEFRDWSVVQRRLGSGEIAFFQQRIIRVKEVKAKVFMKVGWWLV